MISKDKIIVIDCANVACNFIDGRDNLGDGLGVLIAYQYFKNLGFEVKVFVLARKLFNKKNPMKVMANIDIFEQQIPEKDRIKVPAGSDDDRFFIDYAMKKDAVILTNDLMFSHREGLEGNALYEFNKFREKSRCGYTFIDDEIMIDPDFRFEPKAPKKESSVESNGVICQRCGRHGHDKKNCFYNSHIDGRKLISPSNM